MYYTVPGEYTNHGEQTVLLVSSLEKYLLSVTKQKGQSLFRLKSESNERIYRIGNFINYNLFGLL